MRLRRPPRPWSTGHSGTVLHTGTVPTPHSRVGLLRGALSESGNKEKYALVNITGRTEEASRPTPHKKMYWVFGWISGEVCKISDVETYNARIEKASIKIDTQKRNDQLLSLGPEKSRPEITHPKINLVY